MYTKNISLQRMNLPSLKQALILTVRDFISQCSSQISKIVFVYDFQEVHKTHYKIDRHGTTHSVGYNDVDIDFNIETPSKPTDGIIAQLLEMSTGNPEAKG